MTDNISNIINSIAAQSGPQMPPAPEESCPAPILQREAQQAHDARESAATVYKEYQENIKASALIRAELRKGTRAGEDINTLYLKAIKAIGLMIHDASFYDGIAKDLAERENK